MRMDHLDDLFKKRPARRRNDPQASCLLALPALPLVILHALARALVRRLSHRLRPSI